MWLQVKKTPNADKEEWDVLDRDADADPAIVHVRSRSTPTGATRAHARLCCAARA